MKTRIAVTCLGVVSALGRDQREFWANAVERRYAIRKQTLFDAAACRRNLAGQAAAC